MARFLRAASTLSTAVGLATGLQALPASADDKRNKDMGGRPQAVKDNMARAMANTLEKCCGINAVAKSDCAEGAHSCAGQASKARDIK